MHAVPPKARSKALVVDDSKTARVILSRMLERHGLEVDTAPSAEQALDYLLHHRPSVIFMDHMMPGMDGFQAVKEIKNDPRTATIPILMYTAKQGEVYLGEARALGAVGILSKQVRPAELFEVLLSIGLVRERREQTDEAHTDAAEVPDAPESSPPSQLHGKTHSCQPVSGTRVVDVNSVRDLITETLADHLQQNRQQQVGLREDISKTCQHSVADAMEGGYQRIEQQVQQLRAAVETLSARRPPGGRRWLALVAMLAIVVAGWSTARSLTGQAQLSRLHAQRQALVDAVGWGLSADQRGFEFGQAPFGSTRQSQLQKLIKRLRRADFEGVIELRGHVGRFCLKGSSQDGFQLLMTDQPATTCDRIGQTADVAKAMSGAMTDGFSDYLERLQRSTDQSIRVRITAVGDQQPALGYPQPESTTASGWNMFARRNNTVEYSLSSE